MAQDIEVETERDRMKRKTRLTEAQRFVAAMLAHHSTDATSLGDENNLVEQVQLVIARYVQAVDARKRETEANARRGQYRPPVVGLFYRDASGTEHAMNSPKVSVNWRRQYACGGSAQGPLPLPTDCPQHGAGCTGPIKPVGIVSEDTLRLDRWTAARRFLADLPDHIGTEAAVDIARRSNYNVAEWREALRVLLDSRYAGGAWIRTYECGLSVTGPITMPFTCPQHGNHCYPKSHERIPIG